MLSTYTLIYTSPNAKPRAARCNTVATSPPRSISLAYQCMRLSTAKQCRAVLAATNKPKRLASGGHITQQFATLVPKREWVNSPGWTTTASVGTRYLFHMWDLLIRICSCWARLAQEKDAAAHVEHRTPIYPSSQSTGPSRSQHNTTASTSSNIHINAVGPWEGDQCRGCLAGVRVSRQCGHQALHNRAGLCVLLWRNPHHPNFSAWQPPRTYQRKGSTAHTSAS